MVLEGYATNQGIISGLGTTYEIFLQSGNQHVPLQVKELLVGQFKLAQAVLQPSGRLVVSQHYELVVRRKGEKSGNMLLNVRGFDRGKVSYTIEAGRDELPPTWVVQPREQAKRYVEFGCGPALFVDFVGVIYDPSACLIKARVTDLGTGKSAAYYLAMEAGGLISLGHGMCAGAFMLEQGNRFSVEFTLMDASGNLTPWVGPAIPFFSPLSRS